MPLGVDGVLLDLGVSSHQLDTGSRGFSFREDAPLDMRMGNGTTAAELIATASVDDVAKWLLYGDIRDRNVARRIVEKRPQTTLELYKIVPKNSAT